MQAKVFLLLSPLLFPTPHTHRFWTSSHLPSSTNNKHQQQTSDNDLRRFLQISRLRISFCQILLFVLETSLLAALLALVGRSIHLGFHPHCILHKFAQTHQSSLHPISRIDEMILSCFSFGYFPLCCHHASLALSKRTLHTTHLISLCTHQDTKSIKRWNGEKDTIHTKLHLPRYGDAQRSFLHLSIFWFSEYIADAASPAGVMGWHLSGCYD